MGCLDFLIFRFNRVFNVSKGRAAVVAILCFLAGIPLMNDVWAMIGLCLWAYALIYGCIWFYKFNRDRKIVAQSALEAQRYQSSSATARPRGDAPRRQSTTNEVPGSKPVIELTNEITSPGSSRLFVPPPIDRHE